MTIDLDNRVSTISFQCKADGAVSYRWEKQNGVVSSSTTGIKTNVLTITNIQPEDTGYYRCAAVNATGIAHSKYAKLTINGA